MMAQTNQVILNIDEEPLAERSQRNIGLQRMESVSRPTTSNRNSLGFGDRLNNVIRDIRPLVEQARMNNARISLPTWLPRTPPATHQASDYVRPQSSIAHVNLGPTAQTYIVTERGTTQRQLSHPGVSTSVSNDSALSEPDHPEISVSVNPSNNNHVHDDGDNDSHSEDGTTQTVDMRATLNLLIRYVPFFFILLLKFMFDSWEAISTFFVLFSTFSHSNGLVRREHGKQMNRSISALACGFLFTISCVTLVHMFLGHDRLLPNLIMFPGYTEPIDVWELLWLVIMTDLIVKIFTVDVKILVTMMPACILPFQNRGKVYLFVESLSQLYRTMLTIQPWTFFLMMSYEGHDRVAGMFLVSVYVLAKLVELIVRLRLIKIATLALLQSVTLGTKPTREQLLSAGDSCPICHDDYTRPVRLECSHIFCELCISAWLDREHTCPLCRAKVTDEPMWRDGSTTYDFQLY